MTSLKLSSEEGERSFVGRYLFHRGGADLWLQLDEQGRLKSFVVSTMAGLEKVRLSPRTDLCTGALSFRLRIQLPQELPGARIFVDGVQVGVVRWLQEDVTIPLGEHEVRIEKDGYRPIIRHLKTSAQDRGDLVLKVDRSEVQQIVPVATPT